MNIPKGKLVLLGSSSAGKTSLATRFVKNTFNLEQQATIGAAFLTQVVNIGKTQFMFEIWDTAGQERYAAIAPAYYREAAFVLVVYDVSDAKSYERAKQWVAEVKNSNRTPKFMALCGNKCDLVKEEWQVDSSEAQTFAQQNQMIFSETSAKLNKNVVQVFTQLAEQHIKANPKLLENDGGKIRIDEVEPKKGCC
ncbi:Rab1a [Hexamita inflata]|uniref:Rab1a n=1 Tax=Hexamita inflata TaxID=28002 RepID=A0AA86REC0_9EUKA|nr:Rab1a [Hexamita inflata]